MRLISVSRVYNEDDIIEAFVRHHAAIMDHFLFLDNGSKDRTLSILDALKKEGFPISVFQHSAVTFNERAMNTWLYHYADQNLLPDWVCFLDADEFVTSDGIFVRERAIPNPELPRILSDMPDAVPLYQIRLVNYIETPDDNQQEPLVTARLRWRFRQPHDVIKVFVRGGLGKDGLEVDPGNHGAIIGGRRGDAHDDPRMVLAHYPRRSGWHQISKYVNGWLKIIASGEKAVQQRWSIHYKGAFEAFRRRGGELLLDAHFMQPSRDSELHVLEPLHYLGGPLAYTRLVSPEIKAIMSLSSFAEDLARQHGKLLDEVPGVEAAIRRWNAELKRLS